MLGKKNLITYKYNSVDWAANSDSTCDNLDKKQVGKAHLKLVCCAGYKQITNKLSLRFCEIKQNYYYFCNL